MIEYSIHITWNSHHMEHLAVQNSIIFSPYGTSGSTELNYYSWQSWAILRHLQQPGCPKCNWPKTCVYRYEAANAPMRPKFCIDLLTFAETFHLCYPSTKNSFTICSYFFITQDEKADIWPHQQPNELLLVSKADNRRVNQIYYKFYTSTTNSS
jgi:hypothetical protein